MARVSYDLHIHSCLSPCGNEDMTPANIAAMAQLKGLDVIALTDHNSCRNCPALMEEGKRRGILVIPGMELTTMEEVHVVCLFPDLKTAMDFDAYVYARLFAVPNREEIFGSQLIYNDRDEVIGREDNLLINSTSISFDQVWDIVKEHSGVMIPAHIEKTSNSLLHNLGFIPPDSKFTSVELKDPAAEDFLKKIHPYLDGCRILCSSDAHYLEDIHEAEYFLDVEAPDIESVLEVLKG